MSSAVKRISEELKQSSCFKSKLASSILDSEISILGKGRDKKKLADFLKDAIVKKLNVKVAKFLEKYENMIQNACNNRRYYLGDESRDCEQFIRMSLCKLYKKRYAYTNFDKVVKSAIKRKAIDFSKSRNSSMKMTITETDFMAMVDDEKRGEDIGLYKDEIICEEHVNYDFLIAVIKIKKMINEDTRMIFTDWDKQIIDKVCQNIKNGNIDIDGMFDGEDNKTELCFRFKVLSKKIREHFDKGLFI